MSKKLMIIVINFAVVLFVTFALIGKIKTYQGLKEVYVAKTEIRKGQEITRDMLTVREVTLNRVGDKSKRVSYYTDVITPDNVKEVIGKYAAYDIIQDEIIVKAKIVDEKSSNINYMYELPEGYYAHVINNTIPGGILQVNDYIDLYIYSKEQSMIMDEPSLRHLKVYDLRDKDGKRIEQIKDSADGEIKEVKYIVLALNDFQLKKLMHYENNKSTIRAVIRNRNEASFDYTEIEYPPYAISSDSDLIDKEREKQILNKIKGLEDKEGNKPAQQPTSEPIDENIEHTDFAQ